MKIIPILAAIFAIGAAASPISHAAPAATLSRADRNLIGQFNRAIRADDWDRVRALVGAPGFRPNLPIDDGSDIEPAFDYILRFEKADIAQEMMATPGWKRTNWNARNTARPLTLAAHAPKLLPVLQAMARQPGFDLNTPRARYGESPLGAAALEGNMVTLRWLVKQPRINLRKRDDEGQTALYGANAEALEYLLSLGRFDVNAGDNHGQTALHRAVHTGDKAAIRVLLADPKIQPNRRNDYGHTALDIGLKLRLPVSQLLMSNAKVRKSDEQRTQFSLLRAQGSFSKAL